MAHGSTIEEAAAEQAAQPTPPESQLDAGFGAEFRELARQRRFVRSAGNPAAAADMASAPASAPAVAPATTPTATPAPAPVSAPAPAVTPAPVAAVRVPVPDSRKPVHTRMTDDQRAMLDELSRMSDRLVEAREEVAALRERAERTEADLVAANDRLMVAQVLVQDAQRATHESAERVAYLEGRCATLQEALELAVHSSILTRWRWRKQLRAASAD